MSWLSQSWPLIRELTLEHLVLSVPPVLLSLLVAVPLGWVAHRHRAVRELLLTTSGLLYAIPSLPLLIMIPIVLGTGLRSPTTMVVALTLYGVALLVRAASDAFGSVPAEVRQSATAIGFSPWALFWRVELPLAGPVLLAGLRVVVVSTVSLVTVGAVIGIRSLGTLFTDGFQRGIVVEIVTGIVLTVLVALVLDALAVLGGRLLLPWTVVPRARGRVAA
ncbi:ABC transporter permease [Cellulomonas carbonis]|uniref:ABC transporter permease n=1 Tax=Cellulomonas carbonis T26 TaxID=947969 RepID=A0A0A0BP73_9CELL|nr:ABC transporter permease subunit [Cellulomonas carbonis]KGM08904.1 ABC transporter permease [Cellulomonas carbonis T26]GGC13643.1 ABC transporter permease [Cellulomonas carbonis]